MTTSLLDQVLVVYPELLGDPGIAGEGSSFGESLAAARRTGIVDVTNARQKGVSDIT